MVDRQTIQQIADWVAQRFDVERIILFGSYARGDAGKHSDVDLLVVMPGEVPPLREGNPVRLAIAERFVLPCDVLLCTSENARRYADDPYSVIHSALKEGVLLYDRSTAGRRGLAHQGEA